jgi:hypothetical protein
MKILFNITLLFLALSVSIAQESNKAGTTAAQFLKIGVGAKSVSMGGAVAGLVDDATSMYWNPAGLTGVRSVTLISNYNDWFLDINHQYFGLVFPFNESSKIGINATFVNMDEMEVTTERNPSGTGNFFKASDVSIGLTYAVQIVDFFSFGINVKFISQTIYNESATGFAIDLGTKLNTGYKGIKIGMAMQNFGTSMQLDGTDLLKHYDQNPNNATNIGVKSKLVTEAWDLPLNIKVGIGWDLLSNEEALWWNDMHKLKLGIDFNHPFDSPEYVSAGTEYTWHNLLSLRGGYSFNDGEKNYSLGAGVFWQISGSIGLNADYGFVNYKRLNGIHSFSVGIIF